MEQEERLGDEVETVREFTHLGDRVSTHGGCEAAVTARTRCVWNKMLYGRRCPLKVKGAAYDILYGSEAWCMK